MSSNRQVVPSDPADAFAILYDQAPTEPFRDPARVEGWRREPKFTDLCIRVRDAVWAYASLQPFVDALGGSDDAERDHVAMLVGIDRAFEDVHAGRLPAGRLVSHVTRHLIEGRFSTNAIDGAVLPRFVRPADEPEGAASIDDLLVAIIRVPGEAWAAHEVKPLDIDLDRLELVRGPLAACAPMVGGLGELDRSVVVRNGHRSYRISPNRPDELATRLPTILERLDRSRAVIGVLPELTLTVATLDAWVELIRRSPRPSDSRLRIILLGTGHLTADVPPANRAVLVDRDSGSILAEQDKIHGFTLRPEQLKTWNLDPPLGPNRIDEHVLGGARLVFLESLAGRLVILICQDLGEPISMGPHIRAFGASYILAPVLSKPTTAHRWEHSAAKAFIHAVGSTVIVANSLAIGSPAVGALGGFSLVATPREFAIGCAGQPMDVVAFEPRDDLIRVTEPMRDDAPVWMDGSHGC
jgi:predicted amidohydrolase